MAKKSKPSRTPRKAAPKTGKPGRSLGRRAGKPAAGKPRRAAKNAWPVAAKGRRALRRDNLEAFEKHLPDIHARLLDFTPISRLEYDDNGVPDIVFNDQYFYNKKTVQYAADQMRTYWGNPLRFTLSTLNPRQFDKYAGQFLHNLLQRATEKGMKFAPAAVSWKTYFVLSYGVGLGGHIDPLVDETDCYVLMLLEPSLEFVYHSLETYDWKALFEKFEKRNGKVFLFVDNKPEYLARRIRISIRSTNPMSLDGMIIFSHYNNAVFAKTSYIMSQDRDLILIGLGFLDDEIMMIENAHGNLYAGTSRIYLRPSDRPVSLPAFVVGSGPSLDRDIKSIKENADKAVVISCGSAVRPLLVNGIVPDFQVEVENIGILPLVEQVAKDFDLSPVRLLTSVTGQREPLKYFKEIIFYFRGSLSPYPIFFESETQTLRHCNPTVSNAALSFAQEIGCHEIYLFGTDMGSLDSGIHHSKDAYHYTKGAKFQDQIYNMPVPANFGGTCHTNMGLYWARDALSTAMKTTGTGQRYYNCANGAFIEGALAKNSSSIRLKDVPGGKRPIIDKLVENFSIYTPDKFDDHWQDRKFVKSVKKYLETVRQVFKKTKDYSDKRYLKDLLTILENTHQRTSAAMALMFRGSIYMAMMSFVFYRDRLTNPKLMKKFDAIGRQEMIDVIDTLRDTAISKVGKLSKQAGPREAVNATD